MNDIIQLKCDLNNLDSLTNEMKIFGWKRTQCDVVGHDAIVSHFAYNVNVQSELNIVTFERDKSMPYYDKFNLFYSEYTYRKNLDIKVPNQPYKSWLIIFPILGIMGLIIFIAWVSTKEVVEGLFALAASIPFIVLSPILFISRSKKRNKAIANRSQNVKKIKKIYADSFNLYNTDEVQQYFKNGNIAKKNDNEVDINAIKELKTLHDNGTISEAEFIKGKNKLLS